jgi:hypothetical protein
MSSQADHHSPEPWVAKRQLADHLSVTPRWIELKQPLGLPRLSTGGMSRYRISEVEAWLRERYGSLAEPPQTVVADQASRRWFASNRPDPTDLSRIGTRNDLSRSGGQIETSGRTIQIGFAIRFSGTLQTCCKRRAASRPALCPLPDLGVCHNERACVLVR